MAEGQRAGCLEVVYLCQCCADIMVWGILFVGVSELCEDSVINVYFNDNSLKNNVFCHLSPALIQGYTKRLHLKQSCLLDTLPVTVSSLHGTASL